MREEVYEYLKEYGFSAIEIDEIEKKNENMYFTNIDELRKNLNFLEEKYLEIEDIIEIINSNPFMLTEKNNRLEAIDDIFGTLNIDYESLKEIIKKNPKAYTLSPIELQKIIDYLKTKNCDNKMIKDLIIKNPQMISMKFEEFVKVINLN